MTLNNKIFFVFLRNMHQTAPPDGYTVLHMPEFWAWRAKLFLISWTHRGFIFKLTFKGPFPHLTSRMYQSMNPVEVWHMPYLDICPKSIKLLREKDKGHYLSRATQQNGKWRMLVKMNCSAAGSLYGFLLSVYSLKEKNNKNSEIF